MLPVFFSFGLEESNKVLRRVFVHGCSVRSRVMIA
jgi:hypothetical protein